MERNCTGWCTPRVLISYNYPPMIDPVQFQSISSSQSFIPSYIHILQAKSSCCSGIARVNGPLIHLCSGIGDTRWSGHPRVSLLCAEPILKSEASTCCRLSGRLPSMGCALCCNMLTSLCPIKQMIYVDGAVLPSCRNRMPMVHCQVNLSCLVEFFLGYFEGFYEPSIGSDRVVVK
jgi:hypothetical protein